MTITLVSREERRIRLCAIEDYGAQIGERIVIGRRHFGCCFDLFLLLARPADPQIVAADGDDVTGLAVDFHSLRSKGQCPGCLQNSLRVGIGEDNGGFIVDTRVDVGLDLLCDGGDGKRALAVHEPGHQVSSVTAEIE